MSDQEGILKRWSRLKRHGLPPDFHKSQRTGETCPASEPSLPTAEMNGRKPAVDTSCLPPIESIDARTDIRKFLATGVPAKLTCAALRRAWTSDPDVRDFIGLSENSCDFNAPGTIPGFGPIAEADAERLMGHVLEPRDGVTAQGEPGTNYTDCECAAAIHPDDDMSTVKSHAAADAIPQAPARGDRPA